jgi:hypothetical protein
VSPGREHESEEVPEEEASTEDQQGGSRSRRVRRLPVKMKDYVLY